MHYERGRICRLTGRKCDDSGCGVWYRGCDQNIDSIVAGVKLIREDLRLSTDEKKEGLA